MNEQTPMNDPFDHREARRQRREARLADPSRTGSWVAGLVLILLGGMFLMRNMGTADIPIKNWWALFILIPAIGSFDSAIRIYHTAGNQFNAAVRSTLLVATVLTLITIIFLFDISWTFFGPILIILVGLAILLNYMLDNKE